MAGEASETGGIYRYVLGISLPICLYFLVKLFPAQAKKVHEKISAWVASKIMVRIHLMCTQQKNLLFRSLEQLQQTKGNVPHILEIGVGSGRNLAYLPKECTLSCLEPNLENKKYVVHALQGHPGVHLDTFSGCFAEDMSQFEDNTFDAVVCTFTLCTVTDPGKAISEIKRVLKPGGSFFFMEHVAAPRSSFFRSVQECVQIVWPTIADGCHLTRETWNFINDAGFSDVKLTHFELNILAFAVLNFGIYGTAKKLPGLGVTKEN